jgi:hypothetical protein
MADFLAFTEGRSELANNGLPATCYFLLSTKSVDGTSAHTANETLAGASLGEISGTGYARQSQAEPSAVVLVTGSGSTGKAICAWNLIAAGGARDLSQSNTTEQTTPSLNVG